MVLRLQQMERSKGFNLKSKPTDMNDIICPYCGKPGVRIESNKKKTYYYPVCTCDGFDETLFNEPSEIECFCTVLNRLKNLDPISREILESNLNHLFEVHHSGTNVEIENERNKFYQLLSDIVHVETKSTIVPWIDVYFALKL